jgi:hypothetical protein
MIEMPFDFQALQFESCIKDSEDMIVLCDDPTHRCFAQSGVLFERFMEAFYRPPFLIGR